MKAELLCAWGFANGAHTQENLIHTARIQADVKIKREFQLLLTKIRPLLALDG